jgi:hypothetical protein
MTFSNAVAAGAAWRSSRRSRRPKRSRASCRASDSLRPRPPSIRHAHRRRRNSRSSTAGSEPTHRRPVESSPTHRRTRISAPDKVPVRTTPAHTCAGEGVRLSRWHRGPCFPRRKGGPRASCVGRAVNGSGFIGPAGMEEVALEIPVLDLIEVLFEIETPTGTSRLSIGGVGADARTPGGSRVFDGSPGRRLQCPHTPRRSGALRRVP